MSLISKPVDWDVFSIPPIQSVQYYSILKKQREFSQLIKQYDAQIFRHGYLHYCGIVPKYLSSSFSNKCEIFIVFLDETPTTSFIGFRVKVSKETFTYESKSLLLFLKNSDKAVFYSMNNNRIHVHCGTNPWELFYLLYGNYLRKYVLTIIGTQFFYHFVYSYCIEKEKQFLKCMSKGSKVIRVSKSSIYYKIHRKRKISVTDLIHMTVNMPKRKKYTLSSFALKNSSFCSDAEYSELYTVDGKEVKISKLILKKFKNQNIVSEKSQKSMLADVTRKRKYDEIDVNPQNLELDSLSKNFKTPELCSTENQWKQYQKLNPPSIQDYSSISFISSLVPSLLNNKSPSCNTHLYSTKTHSSLNLPFSLSYDSKDNERKNSTVISQNACVGSSREEKHEKSEILIEKTSLCESKSKTYPECVVVPKDSSSHNSSFSKNNHLGLTKSCDINSIHFLTNVKDNDSSTSEDVNFTTAAGNMINISPTAMLKAYKLCETEQILPEKASSDVKQKVPEKNITEVPEKIIYTDSKIKTISKEISLPKISEKMPKKIAATYLPNTKKQNLDNFDVTEDVTFSTAAGKTISVSNTAMEAAQKLIYDVNDEEKLTFNHENLSVQKKKFCREEISNNGCTSKSDDVDMDNTLVEKFFEDVHFDEKELELTKSDTEKDNLTVTFELKSDKGLPTRKPRKSLGGRRSMRYCSDKL